MSTVNPVVVEKLGSPEHEFERLHRRTQIRRMRQLALDALTAYDLPITRLTLQAHLFNTTFRVDTSDGQRYMLRIKRAGDLIIESVEAELAWLTALRRDTPLEVPAPVSTRSNTLLTLASAPGVSQSHICVLFHWLPGRLFKRGLTPRQMERVGELTAHLQNHAAQWTPPPGFARGRVDWPIEAARGLDDPFAPEVVTSIEALVADTLSRAEAAQVVEALAQVRAAEHTLDQGSDVFGLIHADLHYRNLLFARGTVRAIDFDDCGFGPYLYDLAVMLSEILDWTEFPALRAGLLAGYRRVRPLPIEHEEHLDTFVALRRLQDALWMLEAQEHPAIGYDWTAEARRALAPLSALLTAKSDI